MSKPLEGLRILDLSRLLPGPLATQMLGDMGAEVIKIEDTGSPDYVRNFPPHIKGQSLYYLAVNRSKKSLYLNLKSDKGKEIFLKLVETADVVIDSFRPGILKKMGIDYDKAKEHNPAIIYVAVTGYGQESEFAQKAGHDINYLGYTGILSLNANSEGVVMPPVQYADIVGGSYATVMAVMAAYIEKQRTGKGQQVDVAMTDVLIPLLVFQMAEYLNSGKQNTPGSHMLSGGLANYNVYKCKDGKSVALGSLEPKFWMQFCDMIGKPEWKPRIFPSPEMVAALKKDLSELFLTLNRDEWVDKAKEHDICLTPILDLKEAHELNYFRERAIFTEHEHPEYGKYRSINQPIQFHNKPAENLSPPPVEGEHTSEILSTIGLSENEINTLKESKIIL